MAQIVLKKAYGTKEETQWGSCHNCQQATVNLEQVHEKKSLETSEMEKSVFSICQLSNVQPVPNL